MKLTIVTTLFILITMPLCSFDQPVFYHARYFPGEPRFTKDSLTSIDIRTGGGSTDRRNDNFGTRVNTELFSRYRVHHIIFDCKQNLCNGLFFTANLPIYRIHVLEEQKKEFDSTSVSNMNLTTGFTLNYEDTIVADYIDATVEMGIILPSAKKPAQSTGMPFRFACSAGIYDWITFGGEADLVAFFDKNNGRIWNTTWYFKADHFARGFSILLGHSHSNQKKAPIPWSDEVLPFWNMDTFHLAFSYDAATESCPYAPRVELFYNHVMNGKNIVENSIVGINLGADF